MKKTLITLMLPFCVLTLNAQTKTTTTKQTTQVKKTTIPVKKTTAPTKKPVTSVKKPISAALVLKTTLDSASYAFGNTMATSMKNDGLTALNYGLLIKGLKDAFGGASPLITMQQSQTAIGNLFASVSKQKYAPAINEGKAFLDKNKLRPGVQVTPSGLQYEVLNRGTGVRPTATDTVTAHYKGTLANGKQFDSSYDRGEAFETPVNRVIKGWIEGIQLMQTGSKYRFFIPYNLAYGERGAGADIPPYSTLIFEIELLKVNGK